MSTLRSPAARGRNHAHVYASRRVLIVQNSLCAVGSDDDALPYSNFLRRARVEILAARAAVRTVSGPRAPAKRERTIAVPTWAVTLLGIVASVAFTVFGYALAQDRRITRLEERVASLGRQMQALPKRRGDLQ